VFQQLPMTIHQGLVSVSLECDSQQRLLRGIEQYGFIDGGCLAGSR
jgi:hypothetical protein